MRRFFSCFIFLCFSSSAFAYEINMNSPISPHLPANGVKQGGPIFAFTQAQIANMNTLSLGIRASISMGAWMNCYVPSAGLQSVERTYEVKLSMEILDAAGYIPLRADIVSTNNSATGVGAGEFTSDTLETDGIRGRVQISPEQLLLLKEYATKSPDGELLQIRFFVEGLRDSIDFLSSTCSSYPGFGALSAAGTVSVHATIAD